MSEIKSHSESESLSISFMHDINKTMVNLANSVSEIERERCAQIIEALRDGHDDQITKDILSDAATAIRRSPALNYDSCLKPSKT